MFNHVMVGVNNLEASEMSYDALFGTPGIASRMANNMHG